MPTVPQREQWTRLLPVIWSLLFRLGTGSPDWHVSMFDIHLRKKPWMCCPEHAGVKGNDRADRLAGKASTITNGLRLGRSEVLRNLKHYLRAQNQKHHTIDSLDDRGVEGWSARRSCLKGPPSVRQTLQLFQKLWFKCCFTSTETVGLLGMTGAQDVHLDSHTAPELWFQKQRWGTFYEIVWSECRLFSSAQIPPWTELNRSLQLLLGLLFASWLTFSLSLSGMFMYRVLNNEAP